MDTLAERLKHFLQQNGIASSVFAGICDIPRPTLSQLLNGRNKKVSNELIEKIHRGYPEINVMWLMFGDGDMYVQNRKSAATNPDAQAFDSGVDVHLSGGDTTSSTSSRRISFGDEELAGVAYGATQGGATVAAGRPAVGAMPRQTSAGNRPAGLPNSFGMNYAQHSGSRQTAADDSRTVVSITVFYNDGRFETFVPEKR